METLIFWSLSGLIVLFALLLVISAKNPRSTAPSSW